MMRPQRREPGYVLAEDDPLGRPWLHLDSATQDRATADEACRRLRAEGWTGLRVEPVMLRVGLA